MKRVIKFIDQYLIMSNAKAYFGFYVPMGLLIVLNFALLPDPFDQIVGIILCVFVIACLIAQEIRDFWLTLEKLLKGKGPRR